MTATITLAHAVVTLTLDDATPTKRATELSLRRFVDPQQSQQPKPAPQTTRQTDAWRERR